MYLGCSGFNFKYDGTTKGRCVAKGKNIDDDGRDCDRKTGRGTMAWYQRTGSNADGTTDFVSPEMAIAAQAEYNAGSDFNKASVAMPAAMAAVVAAAVAAALF